MRIYLARDIVCQVLLYEFVKKNCITHQIIGLNSIYFVSDL